MQLTQWLIPGYTQMLGALATWLDKATAQRPAAEADSLLAARLAPTCFRWRRKCASPACRPMRVSIG